jgi:hypothetical protein
MTKYTAREQRHADLGVRLEAADARSMAGARIDDDERSQCLVGRDAGGRDDPHQRVVHRMFEFASVGQHLVLVRKQRRLAGSLVLDVSVAALAQRVPKERGPLPEIDRVLGALSPEVPRRPRAVCLLHLSRARLLGTLAVDRECLAHAPLQARSDVARNACRPVDCLVEIGH